MALPELTGGSSTLEPDLNNEKKMNTFMYYCKSGNFCCKNIFIVDGGSKINLTNISKHY